MNQANDTLVGLLFGTAWLSNEKFEDIVPGYGYMNYGFVNCFLGGQKDSSSE